MTFRNRALIAILALLGVAVEQAAAQPVAPPRRPTFSSYSSLLYPGGGYYGYGFGGPGGYGGFGWGGAGAGANALMQQQNLQLQQQLNSFNQNITNLQQFLATGVNPNFP